MAGTGFYGPFSIGRCVVAGCWVYLGVTEFHFNRKPCYKVVFLAKCLGGNRKKKSSLQGES